MKVPWVGIVLGGVRFMHQRQLEAEVRARCQTRPANLDRVELGALALDELVEGVRVEELIQALTISHALSCDSL